VVFASIRDGEPGLYRERADFSGPAERLLARETRQPGDWSTDGKLLVFVVNHPTTQNDIWVLPLEGDGEPRPFVQTPFYDALPALSPDGQWLAYQSDDAGEVQVYVQRFPEGGRRWQISTDGGNGPVWSPDGRELFFNGADVLLAVQMATEPELTVGTPRVLFEETRKEGVGFSIDVAPDGQRFMMIWGDEEAGRLAGRRLSVVFNWFEELKARVPTGK